MFLHRRFKKVHITYLYMSEVLAFISYNQMSLPTLIFIIQVTLTNHEVMMLLCKHGFKVNLNKLNLS